MSLKFRPTLKKKKKYIGAFVNTNVLLLVLPCLLVFGKLFYVALNNKKRCERQSPGCHDFSGLLSVCSHPPALTLYSLGSYFCRDLCLFHA